MTKDLDLFILPGDFSRVLDICAAAGFGTQVSSRIGWARSFESIMSSISFLAPRTDSVRWIQIGLYMPPPEKYSNYRFSFAPLKK